MIFKNRKEAAILLAKEIKRLNLKNPLVLGIPRGGIVTAKVIAQEIGAELDIVVARKLGVPEHEELGFGAIAPQNTLFINKDITRNLNIKPETIGAVLKKEGEELKRRLGLYRSSNNYNNLQKKDIILVDDGVATGVTIRAATMFVKKNNPNSILVTAPVCEKSTAQNIKKYVQAYFLYEPEYFYGVGQFYKDFPQVTDQEVAKEIE